MTRAKTICPICKEEVIETCEGCIEAGTLVHLHNLKTGIPDIIDDIKWEIIK